MITVIYKNGKPKDDFDAVGMKFSGNTLIVRLVEEGEEVRIDTSIIFSIIL